jgi:maltose alpha-D-glucosyltransferase/alpha-amylase
VRAEAEATLQRLQRELAHLEEQARGPAEQVLAGQREMLARIDAVAPRAMQAAKIRYHGDYHLGQVLLNRNDFFITDFEGEPARSVEERRAKHSPMRDVAGMLRSFDYARASALLEAVAQQPDDFARLEPLARAWESEVRRVFLAAYEQASAGGVLYRDFADMRGLIALFEMEKAFYELRYELDNRPSWVAIPLRGLLRQNAAA